MKKNLFISMTIAAAVAIAFVGCEPEADEKSNACEIVSFTVDGEAWEINGTDITHTYPSETAALTPTITLSPGATVNPLSGVAQNFFTDAGVSYTVTAEDGTTTKTYIAKAGTPSNGCEIVTFTVDGVAWEINGTNITHTYPPETTPATLTPTITLSPGATVTPPSGAAQNFFTETGVSYTVTEEDVTTKKIYIARAIIQSIASGTTGECTWTLTGASGSYTLAISGTGAMDDYEYTIINNEYHSTAPWDTYREDIKTAVIQEGVTTIGNYAFAWCSGLTGSLTIPNSVTTIGDGAFEGCSGFTGSLTIPHSVTTIGNDAFVACSGFTGSLTIGNSVTTIGNSAFQSCSGFTGSLTIGNSVTTIGEFAFSLCIGFTGSLTIGNSVTTIGKYAFSLCSGFTGSLTIPESVTAIGEYAFQNCSGFTGSLTIPNSVTTIGEAAFRGCNGFTGSLTIPNSVTAIGKRAFVYCSGLTAILVDESNQNHSSSDGVLFNKDKTTLIQCPGGKTGSYTVPNSVTTIGAGAFGGCSSFTGSLTIGNSVTTIGEWAFDDCSGFTGSLTIPNSVTTIGNYAFYGCSGLTGSLTIGNSVTTIGEGAFRNCSSLTGSLTIPNSVTTIGNYAFLYCYGFTGFLTIGNSVTTIGEGSFFGCTRLTEVTNLRTTPQSINSSVFNGVNKNMLRVPAGSVTAYREAAVWKEFGNIVGIP
jgi:hypothetical protein